MYQSPYPTYEEWKQRTVVLEPEKLPGPYPTYEEWKRLSNLLFCQCCICPYPTYEEWKPEILFIKYILCEMSLSYL